MVVLCAKPNHETQCDSMSDHVILVGVTCACTVHETCYAQVLGVHLLHLMPHNITYHITTAVTTTTTTTTITITSTNCHIDNSTDNNNNAQLMACLTLGMLHCTWAVHPIEV